MDHKLLSAALGLSEPWFVDGLDIDERGRRLNVCIDFRRAAHFTAGDGGARLPHDTRTKHYRHLNFFQHECELEARVPRVRLPDGRMALVEPPWAGRSSGFTLLFEALVVAMCREMPFAAAARLAGLSPHRVQAIYGRHVDLALEDAETHGAAPGPSGNSPGAGRPRRRPEGGRVGLHRHVAGVHRGRRRTPAQRPDHL